MRRWELDTFRRAHISLKRPWRSKESLAMIHRYRARKRIRLRVFHLAQYCRGIFLFLKPQHGIDEGRLHAGLILMISDRCRRNNSCLLLLRLLLLLRARIWLSSLSARTRADANNDSISTRLRDKARCRNARNVWVHSKLGYLLPWQSARSSAKEAP